MEIWLTPLHFLLNPLELECLASLLRYTRPLLSLKLITQLKVKQKQEKIRAQKIALL